MTLGGPSQRHRGRRVGVAAVVAAAVLSVASVAWACVPAHYDMQTKISGCTPPSGSPKPCKTPVGAPEFPEANFVKGPSGSSLVAYVSGPGMPTAVYDLVFASKLQLANGQPCNSSASVKIGGSATSTNQTISPTAGTIPPNSPLGLNQICFADVMRGQTGNTGSTPAQFKVTV